MRSIYTPQCVASLALLTLLQSTLDMNAVQTFYFKKNQLCHMSFNETLSSIKIISSAKQNKDTWQATYICVCVCV